MATHSDIFAWKIPCLEKPGELQSIRLQRVGHDWATNTHTHTHTHTHTNVCVYKQMKPSNFSFNNCSFFFFLHKHCMSQTKHSLGRSVIPGWSKIERDKRFE